MSSLTIKSSAYADREGRAGTDDEGAAASEAVNIVAMLFPFLPEPPQPSAGGADEANAGLQTQQNSKAEVAAPKPASAEGNYIIDSREEGQAVRAFLHARPAQDSLHVLAVSAVEQLASEPSRFATGVHGLSHLDSLHM